MDDEEWAEHARRVAEEKAEEKAIRDAALADLSENRKRREAADAEVQAAREDLARLLANGQKLDLDVSEMARVSGISRDTAHRRLKEVGSVSRRELLRQMGRESWQKRQREGTAPSLEETEARIRNGLGRAKPEPPLATLPPGRYFLGDPVYTLGGAWAPEPAPVVTGSVDGQPFVGVPTAFGDGVFLDQEGYQYPVDSGFLAAIPARAGQKETNLVRLVEFTEPVVVECRGGLVRFGNLEIDTDPNGELKAQVGNLAN